MNQTFDLCLRNYEAKKCYIGTLRSKLGVNRQKGLQSNCGPMFSMEAKQKVYKIICSQRFSRGSGSSRFLLAAESAKWLIQGYSGQLLTAPDRSKSQSLVDTRQ